MANNVKYRQIKAFCLAVETGSFTAAAQAMHVTQPSFTALIKALEDDVGQRLFDRTTRRCEPTAGGQAFYQNVSRAMLDLEEAYQHAREEGDGQRGRLTVATVPSLSFGFLGQVLGAFHRRHPDVRLFMSEQRGAEVLDAVRQNQAELGIGRLADPQDDLTFTPLFTDRLVLAAPLGHALLEAPAIHWTDIQSEHLILIGGGATEQHLRAALPGSGYGLEVTHLATAISLARHGMGVAVVPTSAIDALNVTGLGFAPIDESTATRQLGAIHKRHRTLSTAARRFVDLVRDHAVPAMTDWEARVPLG